MLNSYIEIGRRNMCKVVGSLQQRQICEMEYVNKFSRFEEHPSAVIIIAGAICAVPWKIERRGEEEG
jgi:hypothetical protein